MPEEKVEPKTYTTKDYGRAQFGTGLVRTPESIKFVQDLEVHGEGERSAGPIPGKYSVGDKGSPCENQGSCGSCWDFGLTKALRSSFMIAEKDPGTLAFNYLLNNCGKSSDTHMYGCGGGDFIAGNAFLNGEGPWLEKDDPYKQSEGSCKNLPPAATALKMVKVGAGSGAPTFEELARALADNRYLCVDVAVAGSWGSYSGGIYNGDGSGINHIVNMVGYNMETSVDKDGNALFDSRGQPKNGDGYLIVRNNWGEVWGENGDMRTRWGKNQIAETAVYFEIDAPIPPPPVPPGPVPPPPPVPPTPIDFGKLLPYVIVGLGTFSVGVVLGGLLVYLIKK